MAIRYDPALISALAAHVGERWRGCRVRAARFDAASRSLALGLEREGCSPEWLVFLLHPEAGHVIRAAGEAAPGGGADHPFRRLFLSAVRAPVDERLLVLELAGGRRDVHVDLAPVYRLYVELHTNQWNAILARGATDRIEEVLWPRSPGGRVLRVGATYGPVEGARAWADRPPTPSEWMRELGSMPPGERRAALLTGVAWTSAINVDWILGRSAADPDPELLPPAMDRYLAVRRREDYGAWVLDPGGSDQPYPLPLGGDAERCGDLLDAMGDAAVRAGAWPPDRSTGSSAAEAETAGADGIETETATLEAELDRRIESVRRRGAALGRQLAGNGPEELRQIGHLILARQGEIPRGASSVTLRGFDGSDVEVELDPRLDAFGNAEKLYESARRRARALAAVPAMIRQAEERLARLEAARKRLRSDGPSDDLWSLVGGRGAGHAGTGDGRHAKAEPQALPYRRYRSSGGLEIRVGRSSRGNDDLTFRHSSPEDIWLHARQAAGAHVILRWDRRDQHPPRRDLAEAAVLAAVHSEARHSGMVAVDWTRRKYVRKPRKAPPGAVVPERVSTLFVEPDPEIGPRLSVEE